MNTKLSPCVGRRIGKTSLLIGVIGIIGYCVLFAYLWLLVVSILITVVGVILNGVYLDMSLSHRDNGDTSGHHRPYLKQKLEDHHGKGANYK